MLFLALSCLGTKGVKGAENHVAQDHPLRRVRLAALFGNWWLLALPLSLPADTVLYIATLTVGYICLLMAGLWMSRLLKTDLLEDVFNVENESFMQETKLKENEYSVNLRTRFRFRGRGV